VVASAPGGATDRGALPRRDTGADRRRSWFGLFAPVGTSRDIVLKLNEEVRRIFDDPEYQQMVLAPNLLEPLTNSPEQNAELTKANFARWAKVIRGANLKVD
jgi:tripartite-type tricarboxylate transporter receptor subunit TctC